MFPKHRNRFTGAIPGSLLLYPAAILVRRDREQNSQNGNGMFRFSETDASNSGYIYLWLQQAGMEFKIKRQAGR